MNKLYTKVSDCGNEGFYLQQDCESGNALREKLRSIGSRKESFEFYLQNKEAIEASTSSRISLPNFLKVKSLDSRRMLENLKKQLLNIVKEIDIELNLK